MNSRPPIDAPRRCRAETKDEVIECYIFCLLEVADRICLSCRQLHASRRKHPPQSRMIQPAILYLLRKDGNKLIRLLQQLLQSAAGPELKVHIAGIHLQLNGVVACLRTQTKRKRMLQRIGSNSQFVLIQLFHIHIQLTVHIFTVKPHISLGLHFQQCIVTRQMHRRYRRL